MGPPRIPAHVELDAGTRTFVSGLLVQLVSALRSASDGTLIGLTASDPAPIESDLETWSRITGHPIVGRTVEPNGVRWVIRRGPATVGSRDERPIGERLWLYLNFDCNLQCDYCCVRSSPTTPRRGLGLEAVCRIAREAPPLGVREFFVTGGEPFLLPDIADQVIAIAGAAPVTVLTNGAVSFEGRVTPDPSVLLRETRKAPDPERLVLAEIPITVPP